MIPVFMMMVGLPGSGKSTWANKYAELSNSKTVVLSSDIVRKQLFPNASEILPKHNEQVFSHMLKQTKKYLGKGVSVIYDATNLNKRRRMHVLRELDKTPCRKICTLMIASVESCVEQNSKRESVVPKEVIHRMRTQFQPPHTSEGWDYIYVSDSGWLNNHRSSYLFSELREKERVFVQENSHHDFTLLEHQSKTQNYVLAHSSDSELVLASRYHDIGKMWTKAKGIDGECHYYNHHCVGAYEFILYAMNMFDRVPGLSKTAVTPGILNVSNYIYYHMHPWQVWDRFSKAKQKDLQILGESMFEKIMLLSEADQHSQKEERQDENNETV